jgi:streptogramin lyase
VAEGLPIGLSAGPGMPPPYVPTGVAVAADGTVFFSADRNNAIYRIRPAR